MAAYEPAELEIVYFDQPEVFMNSLTEMPVVPYEPEP